jgi:purine-nucleoside phosphorylase
MSVPVSQKLASPSNIGNHTRGNMALPHKSASMPSIERDDVDIITDFLKEATTYRPSILVVCGSGLGGLSKCLSNQVVFHYNDIPKFPKSTVAGHAGELVFGELDGLQVVCMRGRFHTYEGHDVRSTTLPIRVMFLLGVKHLIVTNAAGALNPDYSVRSQVYIVTLSDEITSFLVRRWGT